MRPTTSVGETTGVKAKAVVYSDDLETARVWGHCIQQAGADVVVSEYCDYPMQLWSEETPDLIIIESITNCSAAIELCQKLRQETPAPIIFLPSGDDEIQLFQVYQAGADDCLPPPVSPRLFMMKIRAWLRRSQVVPAAVLEDLIVGPFCLNTARRRLTIKDCSPIRLTSLETRLLFLLMHNQGRVLDTDYLTERVWGYYGNGDRDLLKNLVYRLRHKIEPDPTNPVFLLTRSPQGYLFQIQT